MSLEENKAVVQRFCDLWNSGDREKTFSLFAENAVDPGLPGGKEGIVRFFNEGWDAFPDSQLTILDMVAEGDKVVCKIIATGTHKGTFLGVPPTGKVISGPQVHFFRVENGLLVEHWGIDDVIPMLTELGLLSPLPLPPPITA